MRRRGASHGDSGALNCPLGLPRDTCLPHVVPVASWDLPRPVFITGPSSVPSVCIPSLLSFSYRESSLFLTSVALRSNCQCCHHRVVACLNFLLILPPWLSLSRVSSGSPHKCLDSFMWQFRLSRVSSGSPHKCWDSFM
jgi:hypothetical protein